MNKTIKKNNYQDRLLSGVRRKSFKAAYITSISSSLAGACMLSNTMQLFAIKLGASEFYLGLLSFFIAYTGFFSFFSMHKIEIIGKRAVLFRGWAATTLIMLALVFMPLWAQNAPQSHHTILWIVLFIIAVRGICDGYGTTAWFPILQDNVPSRITGKFFARFRVFWQTSILLIVWAMSAYLGHNATYGKFMVIFSVGFIFLVIRAVTCTQIAELPPSGKTSESGFFKRLSGLLDNKPLRTYLLYLITYNLAIFMPSPFQIKMLKNFGYSDGYVMLATSMIQLSAIFTLKFWGKISDRYGNRAVFSICVLGNMINILLWLLIDGQMFSRIFVFVLYFMWGLFTAGCGIAQTRHMLHNTPKSNQSAIVLINIASSVSVASAPLIGGMFLSASQNWQLSSGAVNLNNYHILFLFCTLLFIIPYNLRRKLRITEENSTSYVMSAILRPLKHALDSFIRVQPENMTDDEDQNERN